MTLTYTDAFAMTNPDVTEPQITSETLDPLLVKDLQGLSRVHADTQDEADNTKWNIAGEVNDAWDEHSKIFPTKMHYYAECSRVLNTNRTRKYFSDSGETLRRYCELRATYDPLIKTAKRGDEFLELFTMEHLRIARSLYMNGKVKSPFEALDWCVDGNGKMRSADEMEEHFDTNRNSTKSGFVNFLSKFLEKQLPKLKLPETSHARAKELINELLELLK